MDNAVVANGLALIKEEPIEGIIGGINENGVFDMPIAFPVGETEHVFVVKEDGIYEEFDQTDKNGNIMPDFRVSKLVIQKDAFMAAYNAYIKNEKEDDDVK